VRFSAPRVLAAIAALAMTAAGPALKLTAPHKGELPRIASPATPAAAKINAALATLDRRWGGYVRGCRAGGKDNEASRTAAVTMTGPRFLSIVASDEESCGGAHPDNSTLALVYDLTTGRPVDWRQLLGPRLVTATRTDTVIDGTRSGFAKSPELSQLYLRALRKSPDYDPAWWKECQETLTDEQLEFVLWPDARKHGLVAEPQVVHAVAPCAEDVAIPAAELRQAGASADLVAAMGGP
jgi:hypothetical protein